MTTTRADITVTIIPNDTGNPPGKLADAELVFTAGPLAGMRLQGFAIWERRTGTGRNVTFPARQYSVNGERRSFALLRPVTDNAAQECVRDLILAAYTRYEEPTTPAATQEPTADALPALTTTATPTSTTHAAPAGLF